VFRNVNFWTTGYIVEKRSRDRPGSLAFQVQVALHGCRNGCEKSKKILELDGFDTISLQQALK
jgi:hypothetical protein